jgi:hypothetical protein
VARDDFGRITEGDVTSGKSRLTVRLTAVTALEGCSLPAVPPRVVLSSCPEPTCVRLRRVGTSMTAARRPGRAAEVDAEDDSRESNRQTAVTSAVLLVFGPQIVVSLVTGPQTGHRLCDHQKRHFLRTS